MASRQGPPHIVPGVNTAPAGTIRPSGTRHLQRVTNERPEPAVSLHVYAPALTEMNEYAVDGQYLRRTEALVAGRSW